MRCAHCPIPADRRCKGESHRRLCDLRDRDHPDHDPAYLRPIAGEDGAAVRTVPESPPIPLAVTLAVAKCPVRGAPIECGCAAERRYCGETLDLMVWGGCVACKAAGQTAT